MRYSSLAGSMLGVFSADISRLTQTCDVLLQSCDVLFHGEKTDLLAICTSQPPVLKQKGTSQVARSTSQLSGSTSQVGKTTSQLGRPTSQVGRSTSQITDY